MESKQRIVSILIAGLFGLTATSVAAESYRWKDNEGKVHYGAVVPPEYADQPYDILNSAGLVIEHVEDTSIPMEVIIEEKIKEKEPLISDKERRIQIDRLLLVRYRSEEDILNALDLQLAQLGYDLKIVNQSYAGTSAEIREEIRKAADRQRANQVISEEQQAGIDQLYERRAHDEQKRTAMDRRENRIRARFQEDLERYRVLTSETSEPDEKNTDQG